MVKIRLRRIGAKKAPFYRVVVAESKYARDGRFIEEIGTYNPLVDPAEVKIDVERANYWIKNGAQPTDTVKALLKKAQEESEKSITYKVKVAEEDKGQVIGKEGKIAKALRTVTKAASRNIPKMVFVDIV